MTQRISYIILLMAAVLATSEVVHGQQAEAVSRLDSSKILIGQQTGITLELSAPEHSKVLWPFLSDTLTKHIEIVRKSSIDTVARQDGRIKVAQKLVVTVFDSGSYVIPPIAIAYKVKGDTTRHIATTAPLSLEVGGVKIDEQKDIRPIKPPIKAPLTFRELLPWIAALIALTLAIVGIRYYVRRKRMQQPVFAFRPKPIQPPYERAIEALEELKKKKLWQQGQVKEYHSELTAIVRSYIEERFGIPALEMTTWEIMQGITGVNIPAEISTRLSEALSLADMVKFAKAKPLPIENDQSWDNCRGFVEGTRPFIPPAAEQAPVEETVVEPKPEM